MEAKRPVLSAWYSHHRAHQVFNVSVSESLNRIQIIDSYHQESLNFLSLIAV